MFVLLVLKDTLDGSNQAQELSKWMDPPRPQRVHHRRTAGEVTKRPSVDWEHPAHFEQEPARRASAVAFRIPARCAFLPTERAEQPSVHQAEPAQIGYGQRQAGPAQIGHGGWVVPGRAQATIEHARSSGGGHRSAGTGTGGGGGPGGGAAQSAADLVRSECVSGEVSEL